MKTHIRLYICDMGKFQDSSAYEFIAEFADVDVANNYILYMRKKRRYAKKDIIVKEYSCTENTAEGKVAAVITVLGENLPVEEYEFK